MSIKNLCLITSIFCGIISIPLHAKFKAHVHETAQEVTIQLEGSSTKIVIPAAAKHDITQKNDTIVNPANEMLYHGGGVAAAISKAAGPKLQAWSDAIPSSKSKGGKYDVKVQIGQAIISPAFNLTKRGINYVVHTVGPDMRISTQKCNGPKLLYDAWYNALEVAANHDPDIQEIYFPSISTGTFKFDKDAAGRIALEAVATFAHRHPNRFKTITILLWPDTHDAYIQAIEKVISCIYAPTPEATTALLNEFL